MTNHTDTDQKSWRLVLLVPILLVALLTILGKGGGDAALPVAPPNPNLPVTPPDPTTPPTAITTAQQVAAGTATGRVLMIGELTRVKSAQDHEWWFMDGSGPEIELDFPSPYVPPVGTNFTVYGTVDGPSEVDVIAWEPCAYTGTAPTPSPGPNPAIPPTTTVAEIQAGSLIGQMVLVEGTVTRVADDDHNELIFTDGTGEIELDFPSNNVPALGSAIRAYGSVSSGPEIDVQAWEPR